MQNSHYGFWLSKVSIVLHLNRRVPLHLRVVCGHSIFGSFVTLLWNQHSWKGINESQGKKRWIESGKCFTYLIYYIGPIEVLFYATIIVIETVTIGEKKKNSGNLESSSFPASSFLFFHSALFPLQKGTQGSLIQR